MSISRFYKMTAAPGREDALVAALSVLAGAVEVADGCEGVYMLQDPEAPTNILFIEKWATIEHHKAVLENLPADAFDPVAATLAGPPDGQYLDWLL